MSDLKHDVDLVFEKLWAEGWNIQPLKCTLGVKRMTFLGYDISARGKSVHKQIEEKPTAEASQAFLYSQLRSDLILAKKVPGLLNYRKFVPKMQEKNKFVTNKM